MLTKPTILDSVSVAFGDAPCLQVRLAKQTILDGEVLKSEWHRFVLEKGVDVDFAVAQVNAHLQAMGYEPMREGDVARLKSLQSEI